MGLALVLVSLSTCGTERARPVGDDAERLDRSSDVTVSTDLFSPSDSSRDRREDVGEDADVCTTWCDCCGTDIETPYPCDRDPGSVCLPCPCVDLGDDVHEDECTEESCVDCICSCANGERFEVENAACSPPCAPPPRREDVCPGICPGYCSGNPCDTADFMTIDDLEALLDELIDSSIWLKGVLSASTPSCTLAECDEENPCCNDCSSEVGFVTGDTFYGLTMPPEASSITGCWGDECNPFEGCHPVGFGHRVRLEAHVEMDASGRVRLVMQRFCQPPARERRPDAFLSWQSPGGVVGWGPAISVTGDGQIKSWQRVFGFAPESPPIDEPHETINIPTSATDELFARWADTVLDGLPHGSGGAECYPQVYAKLCDDCPADEISYSTASQLTPEMNPVWAWFRAVLHPFDNRGNPGTYCRFE